MHVMQHLPEYKGGSSVGQKILGVAYVLGLSRLYSHKISSSHVMAKKLYRVEY